MFRALADQLWDDEARHAEVRAKTVAHIRAHREVFEGNAVALYLEGLESSQTKTRRQARQKTPDDVFEEYCTQKEKAGTWGEEPEIVAFTEAFDRDVLIYRPDGQGQPISCYQNRNRQGAGVKYVQLAFGVRMSLYISFLADSPSQGEDVTPHYESVRPVVQKAAKGTKATKGAALASSSKDKAVALFTEAKHPPMLDQYNAGPMGRLRQARPNLSSDELIEFIDGCRNQLDDRCAALIDQDRKRDSSDCDSQAKPSAKRAREDNDPDSELPAKQASRGASLRPRTRAFVSTSREGTEISFRVRLDTPDDTSSPDRQNTPETDAEPIGKGKGKAKAKGKKAITATKKGRVQKGKSKAQTK